MGDARQLPPPYPIRPDRGIYLYSDIPFEVSAPVVNYTEVG